MDQQIPREISSWDSTSTVGEMAIQTDTYPQKLVVSDGAQWNEVITSNSALASHTVQDALRELVDIGAARVELEPLIRDIINDVILERKEEQAMFEL